MMLSFILIVVATDDTAAPTVAPLLPFIIGIVAEVVAAGPAFAFDFCAVPDCVVFTDVALRSLADTRVR